jgi:hypothetical protein
MSTRNKSYDATELDPGKTRKFDVPSVGDLDRAAFIEVPEPADTFHMENWLELEHFMNEEVVVEVVKGDKNSEQTFELRCGNVCQFIVRGTRQKIKRKFLELLARAKPDSISTPEFVDASGNRATRIEKTNSLRYPFQVVLDANPRGREWLDRILSEPS